jgi:putative protease
MLDTAFAFGASAIYAGQPRYSLRVRNNDFGDLPVLADGINRAHALGKHFYVVANIYPHGAKIKTFIKDIAPVIALKPDALIMSDPGLILMVRENFPRCPSTCRCRPTRSMPPPCASGRWPASRG